MSTLNVTLLRASFDHVIEKQPELTTRFYEIFFDRYPQVKPLFGAKSQKAQAEMLQAALVSVLEHIEDSQWLTSTLKALGEKHKGYGVTDEMYGWVGECLLAAISEAANVPADSDVIKEWTLAYNTIANIMKGAA